MGAYESSYTNAVLYVSLTSTNPLPPYTNWLTAATNIQAAIGVAQSGNIVAVGQGVYTNDATVFFGTETNRVAVTNGITLLGVAGPAFTVIMGTTQTRCAYVDSNSIISGFTITNGHGSLTGDLTNEQSGGGIWCQPGGQVLNCLVISNALGNFGSFQSSRLGGGVYGGTISNCTLMANVAGSGGGAVNAQLFGCLLVSNIANNGGGACRSTLNNCTASNNVAIYNGVAGTGCGVSQCVASNCLFAANTNANVNSVNGGGSYQGTNFNCTITGNFASMGGGTYQTTNYNCFISRNYGATGGGLFNCVVNGNSASTNSGMGGGAYQAFLVNCTVAGNAGGKLDGAGGGIANCTAHNSIVYFNTASFGSNAYTSTLQACCTFPLPVTGGANNITLNDPTFVDAAPWAAHFPTGLWFTLY